MAKKRSKRRRKTGRSSLPPSLRPSGAPSVRPSNDPAEAKADEADKSDAKADAKADAKTGADESQQEPSKDEPKQAKSDASAAEDDSSHEPGKDAKAEPGNLEHEEPGAKPSEDSASDAEADASPDEGTEPKGEAKDDPDQDEGESDTGEEAAQDDRLHDDFFRKGEEVEKEHIAARAAAANGTPKLEDTGQQRLVALRSTPELVERRKKLRKVVGYVLAPAALIAIIAGFKAFNGDAKARPSPVTSVRVKSQPAAPATISTAASITTNLPTSSSSTADASPNESDDVLDAAVEDVGADVGPDVGTLAASEAGADAADRSETEEEEPLGGVDYRKEAFAALNRAKWEDAEQMASKAIAADPQDATLYLYRGTALQELGRRDEAKAIFKQCVEKARRGPINECRMFAR